jgi:hypothetical protein
MKKPVYPRGKIKADDDGEVTMSFAIQDNTLLVMFPHPTTWIGLGRSDVERLIELLQQKLTELKVV